VLFTAYEGEIMLEVVLASSTLYGEYRSFRMT